MKNRNGFTLVEVVLASMLLGMVLLSAFPLITTGRNVIRREQTDLEARMIGDSVFDKYAEEMQKDNADEWTETEAVLVEGGFDIVIEAEEAEYGWMFLKMTVRKDETIVYEREEIIPLLNQMLFEKREPEGE